VSGVAAGRFGALSVPGSHDLSWPRGDVSVRVTVTVQPDPGNAWPG